MRWTLAILARSAGVFWAAGCGSGAASEAGDAVPLEGPVTGTLIRNEPTGLCLEAPADLTTVAASACSTENPDARWNVVVAAPALYAIRPTSDPTRCLTLLAPEPGGVPVVGPCSEDLAAAGQLFHIQISGSPDERAPGPSYMISDPSDALYMTAVDPGGVVMMERGRPDLDLQRWQLVGPA